jgi:hypothetical protein
MMSVSTPRRSLSLLIATLGGVFTGYLACAFIERRVAQRHQETVLFTVQALSRALEAIKGSSGSYPETMRDVEGITYADKEFSREVAARVFYTKTPSGYVLASGAPMAVIADQRGYISWLSSFKPFIQGAGVER